VGAAPRRAAVGWHWRVAALTFTALLRELAAETGLVQSAPRPLLLRFTSGVPSCRELSIIQQFDLP
jgi:hypothetical protein